MSETVRESVEADELLDALAEYTAKAGASPRVGKTLRGWDCRIHILATDHEAAFTLVVSDGQPASPAHGLSGAPDLVVRGHSFDLAEIFWAMRTRCPTTCRAQSAPRAGPRTSCVLTQWPCSSFWASNRPLQSS